MVLRSYAVGERSWHVVRRTRVLIAAAGWSPTQHFDAGAAQFHEPVPRVAIDAKGGALLAYETGDRRLVVSVRRKDGRFSRPKTLAKRTLDYAVAPGAVAYEAKDGIHVATRTATGFKPRKVASSTGSEINGSRSPPTRSAAGSWPSASSPAAAAPSRTACAPSPSTPPGPRSDLLQDLGLGQFGIDARPTQALAVLPDGRAVLVFQRERTTYGDPQPVVYAVRPHGGTFTAPAVVGDKLTDARVTVAGDRAVLTATMTALCGDTSCAGQPRAIPLNPDGSLGAPVGPTVARRVPRLRAVGRPGGDRLPAQVRPEAVLARSADPRRRAHARRPAANADAPNAPPSPSRCRSPVTARSRCGPPARASAPRSPARTGRSSPVKAPKGAPPGASTTPTPPTATCAPRAPTRSSPGPAGTPFA